MSDSRIAGFYKLDVAERIGELQRRGWLSSEEAGRLQSGQHVLSADAADKIIENVVGVFGLPFAIAPNFVVNGRDYLVPLVVEEPSVVAALSNAAALARAHGGFEASCEESLLAGQLHISQYQEAAVTALQAEFSSLLEQANALHPRLVARGGGACDIELREIVLNDGSKVLAVHLLVDTCDAMGANLVNSMCEALAPRVAEISGGVVELRILSNLCDRSRIVARVRLPAEALVIDGISGTGIRDRIVKANEIALSDPYRAATHNKGIMNGIDPLAIATGNDWRAIEAGAHAFAARESRYAALTRWSVAPTGELYGELELPLKLGTVGGTLEANAAAQLGLAISGVESATELACLMAAVGLAQNFAALRALSGKGIQSGHMRLHARTLVASLGVPDALFETACRKLVASGEIKRWKAQQIVAQLSQNSPLELRRSEDVPAGVAAGKVILLGEHAVVYGRQALALPIKNAVTAKVRTTDDGLRLVIHEWGIAQQIDANLSKGIDGLIATILSELGLAASGYAIEVNSRLPRAMGLGSSAAIAVAIVRAFDLSLGLGLDDTKINAVAFECEKLAHGTPSGIDNTLATYAQAMLFKKGDASSWKNIHIEKAQPLVVAYGTGVGRTSEQVAAVRKLHDTLTPHIREIFDQIEVMSVQGSKALVEGDYELLGAYMNLCHGLLNALGVSTPELEHMIETARQNGAVGAKLTGAGGGGSIVALCPGRVAEVTTALNLAGYKTIEAGRGSG